MFFEPNKGTSKKFKSSPKLTAVERPAVAYELMTFQEFQDSVGKEFLFDIEVYRNYVLIVFTSVETKKLCYLEMRGDDQSIDTNLLCYMIYLVCLVGFNSNKYDLIILAAIVAGFPCSVIKQISDDIIISKMREQEICQKYRLSLLRKLNTYDLKEVAPLDDSLKKYAARMHAKRLQELPYPPHEALTFEQMDNVRDYCFTDNENTYLLRAELAEQHALRLNLGRMYGGIDLRSKSDAQIAETVIIAELTKIAHRRAQKPEFDPEYTFQYKPPAYVCFQTRALQDMLAKVKACVFTLRVNGSPQCDELAGNDKLKIPGIVADINGKKYAMGLGGLHSMEKSQTVVAAPGWRLTDIDFASYYPRMILNNEWYPSHLSRNFLTVFDTIVKRRLHAKAEAGKCKKAKDKEGEKAWKVEADSLKITINGSFGKLGSSFSMLYSPDLLIQTTVTGQLNLLMLIEALELARISVVSANTDGFIVHYHEESQRATLSKIVKSFEELTNMETEETQYSAVYARDVNNYIAVKTDSEVKTKGVYSELGSTGNSRLSKNPQGLIVADAVVAYLTKGMPIIDTVNNCNDLTRFLCVQNVKGGGHQNGKYLGKTVRWIYGKGVRDTINYVESGNTVPDSYGALPLMDLPDTFPERLDRMRYVSEALNALVHIGYAKAPGSLF